MPDPPAHAPVAADATGVPSARRLLLFRPAALEGALGAMAEQALAACHRLGWRGEFAVDQGTGPALPTGRSEGSLASRGADAAFVGFAGSSALRLAAQAQEAGWGTPGLPREAVESLADPRRLEALAKKLFIPSHRAVVRELAGMPASFNEMRYVDAEIIAEQGGDWVPVALVERVGARSPSDPGEALLFPAASPTPIAARGAMDMAGRLAAALGIAGPFQARFALHGDRGSLIEAAPIASAGMALAAIALERPLGDVAVALALGAALRESALPRERHPGRVFACRRDGGDCGAAASGDTAAEALERAMAARG